ncbi:hypothetical protein FQZ97_818560 [compost metagenome]
MERAARPAPHSDPSPAPRRGDAAALARRLAGGPSGGGAAVLPGAGAGGQHRIRRCLLPAPAGRRSESAADRSSQPQGGRLPGAGRDVAGRGRCGGDPQYHRLCPVQPGGAAGAPLPPRRAGAAGTLRAGQRAAMAIQRPGPGPARPCHAHRPARTGRPPDHPTDQLQGRGCAQRTQPERRGALPPAPAGHGLRRRTGAALDGAGRQGQCRQARRPDPGQLPDPRRPHRQRRRPGYARRRAEYPACAADPGLPSGGPAGQRQRADSSASRRRDQRPRQSRPAPLRPEPGAGRLPALVRRPAASQPAGGARALG